MFLKFIPWILLSMGIIGFCMSPEELELHSSNSLMNIAQTVALLPWWGKLLSILIGVIWLYLTPEVQNFIDSIRKSNNSSTNSSTEHKTGIRSFLNVFGRFYKWIIGDM